MKQFIKKKLRLVLENRAKHTSSNPRGGDVKKTTTQSDFNRAMAKISNNINLYNKFDYGDIYEGDGLYQVDLFPNGELVGKLTSVGFKREPGDFSDNQTKSKRSFFVKACTNVQHPDQPEKTCSTIGKSPMEDAVVKVCYFAKNEIIDFLKQNMEGENQYTSDGKGKELSDKNTPDNKRYMFGKKEKELERGKNKRKIKASDELTKSVEARQAAAIARREKAKMRRNKK